MDKNEKENYINVVRFSALMNTADEYIGFVEDTLVELWSKNFYSNIDVDKLNRHQRKKLEKEFLEKRKAYQNTLDQLRVRLSKFSNIFSQEVKFHYVFENMVESLHGTLKNTNFTVRDSFREYYLQKLEDVSVKNRSDEELLRLKSALDNFITLNVNRE